MKALLDTGKRYGVILADPPWNYSNSGVNGSAERHYGTMSPDEIEALPVARLAADDCVLLLWATMPLLDQAIDLARAWGFRHKSAFPWIKLKDNPFVDLFGQCVEGTPCYGMGFWIRGCAELVLICTQGNANPPPPDNVPMGLISKRFQHSRKPNNVYEYGELLLGERIELFARQPWPGWDTWGDQAPNDNHDQTDAPSLSAASTTTGTATASRGEGYGA